MLLKALSIVMDFKQLKQNEVDIPFVPGEVAAAAESWCISLVVKLWFNMISSCPRAPAVSRT